MDSQRDSGRNRYLASERRPKKATARCPAKGPAVPSRCRRSTAWAWAVAHATPPSTTMSRNV